MNRFGHVDLRVKDARAAFEFYSQLLPPMGFVETYQGEKWVVFAAKDALPYAAYFAFTEDQDHHPNANRIAFWAENREEVDRIAEIARLAGAKNIEGPEPCPYSETYYAVFFEDPSGNRFEVYHRLD